MPDITVATRQFVEAINEKINVIGAQYSAALIKRDKPGMASARARMAKLAEYRERFFALLEEIVDDTYDLFEADVIESGADEVAPHLVMTETSAEPAAVTTTKRRTVTRRPKAPPEPPAAPESAPEAASEAVSETETSLDETETESPVNVAPRSPITTIAPSAKALANWPKVRGRVGRPPKPKTDVPASKTPAAPLVKGEYTEVKSYEPYLLRAMVLIGSRARFIDIQKRTLALMRTDNKVKPLDLENTGTTTIPRYIAQTASLRKSLMKRGWIIQHADKTFSLTPEGEAETQRLIREDPGLGLGNNRNENDGSRQTTLVTA